MPPQNSRNKKTASRLFMNIFSEPEFIQLTIYITEQCSVECIHGQCSNGQCECEHMWGGVMCNDRLCDRRCSLHGECHNGTCQCTAGWNGKHCTLGELTIST